MSYGPPELGARDRELLDRVRACGARGHKLEAHELPSSYVLVRRGMIEEIAPWRVRVTDLAREASRPYRGVVDDLAQLFAGGSKHVQ